MKLPRIDPQAVLISLSLLSLPLYVIRCKTFSFCVSPVPFTLLEVMILLTFGYWLFINIKAKTLFETLSALRSLVPTPVKVLVVVFLISGFIGSLVSPSLQVGLGTYKAYFTEGFLLSIVVFDYLRLTKNIRLVVWSLVGSALWIALFAIGNQIFDYNPFNQPEFLDRGRASAIYTTSNAVGLLVGPMIVLFFGYILSLKNTDKSTEIEKKLAIMTLFILLAGILSSGSRGAYLGVLTGFIFFCAFLLYSKLSATLKRIINWGFILGCFGAVLGIFLFFTNISYFANNPPKIITSTQSSFNQRLCLWEGAVNIITDKPLLGSGLSGFQSAHDKVRTCSIENSIYPHNIFLNFWTEVGLFGLISFFGLTAYLFIKLLTKTDLDYFNLGLACVFVVILVHGLLDVPFFKNDLSVGFWVLGALSLYQIQKK